MNQLTRKDIEILRDCGSWELAKIAERYVAWNEKYARSSWLGKLWMRFLAW